MKTIKTSPKNLCSIHRYADCDPNATPSPTSIVSLGSTPTVGTIKDEGADAMMTTEKEDSFETNNQVGLLMTDAYFFSLPCSADNVFFS